MSRDLTTLRAELEECADVLDDAIAEVKTQAAHQGDPWASASIDPIKLRDANGRSLLADLYAEKARVLVALADIARAES